LRLIVAETLVWLSFTTTRQKKATMRLGLALPLSFLSSRRSPRRCAAGAWRFLSVSGMAYEGSPSSPVVSLYTKDGCTLCDEAKSVLAGCATPHTLELVDITDDSDLWDAYKYDIPVLHIEGSYWAKHRIQREDAEEALREATSLKAQDRPFPERRGRPDAKKMEVLS